MELHEYLSRELILVAACAHAVDEPPLEVFEPALPPSRGHRTAQLAGLARSEAGSDHRQLHHLFLEDRHAQGSFQHAVHRLARIGDRLGPFALAQIGMHHAALDPSRPQTKTGQFKSYKNGQVQKSATL